MRFITVAGSILVASASFVAAEKIECQAQNILDACIASTKPRLDACPASDWDCMCTQSANVLTCYNNCPGHSGRFAVESTNTANCNAAKVYNTTSSSAASSPTSSESSSESASESASEPSSEPSKGSQGSPSHTKTGSGSGSEPTTTSSRTDTFKQAKQTGAASKNAAGAAGGVMAAAMMVMGAL